MNNSTLDKVMKNISRLSQLGLFITAIFGIIYVTQELSLLRKQSETAEKNISLLKEEMKLSQKPVGLVRSSYYENPWEPNPAPLLYFQDFPQENEPDQFKIHVTPRFINAGKDALVLIGSIGYRSPKIINFRADLLSEKIDLGDLKYGFIKNFLSRTTILPGDFIIGKFKFYGINYKRTYYFYYIYFYEDINGNLYDTEHIDIVTFSKKKFVKNQSTIDLEGYQKKNTYYSYSENERKKLISFFKTHSKDDLNANTIYLSLIKKSLIDE